MDLLCVSSIPIIFFPQSHYFWLYLPLLVYACVWLFVILWAIAHQAPLFMGFWRQEYWSGFQCPPPGVFIFIITILSVFMPFLKTLLVFFRQTNSSMSILQFSVNCLYIFFFFYCSFSPYFNQQICRWHHPYGRKQRGTKEPLDEGEREE